jgi:enoyl-CoA hydratase
MSLPGQLEAAERNGFVYLRVDEPAQPGALAQELGWALLDWCDEIAQRVEPVLGVVLTGSGGGFFLQAPTSAVEADQVGGVWAQTTAAVSRIAAPTIAVLGADAIGPAWELALACDLRLAASQIRVGNPEVRWGRLPSAGGTQRLTRLVGPGTALRLLLLGEVVAAPAALEIGLLHRVVTPDALNTSLDEVLTGLGASAPIALSYAKEAVLSGADLPLVDGLRLEADLATLLQTTHDRAEGIAAFLERRPARFEAR